MDSHVDRIDLLGVFNRIKNLKIGQNKINKKGTAGNRTRDLLFTRQAL